MQPFTPNKPQYPTQSYIDLSEHWANKAKDNLQTWGIQEPLTVLACMQEELGEIARAVLEGKATVFLLAGVVALVLGPLLLRMLKRKVKTGGS